MQYPSAKVALRDPVNNRILLLKRTINNQVGFEPAGGKVEANFDTRIAETFEECAIREIKEELDLSIAITHYLGSYYFFWSLRPDAVSHCVLFVADILGGEISRVQQDGCGELDYAWVTLEEIKSKSLPIRDYHVGLSKLLTKMATLLEA